MPRKPAAPNTRILVSARAFDAMCKAHAYCPEDLGRLDRMRWMASFMEAALKAPDQQTPEAFELLPLSATGAAWDESKAKAVASAAGLEGTRWSVGPAELAHILNTAQAGSMRRKRKARAPQSARAVKAVCADVRDASEVA